MSDCCSCQPVPSAGACRSDALRTGDWMRVAFAGLIAAQSMIIGMAVNLSPPSGRARLMLHGALALSAIVVFALVGWPLLKNSLQSAWAGRATFEQFFMIGILSAFGASLVCTITGEGHVYYEVVAILLAIYTFGRILADRRRDAALDAARALGREFERCDRIRPDGSTEVVRVEEIRVGDTVRVPVGAGIPIDGEITAGSGYVVETPLTGEPFPVVKRVGDSVFAGSQTVDSVIEVRAVAAGGARQLDRIFARVRAARENPAHVQREADRLVAWFLPVVLIVAAGTFAFWTAREGWQTGLFNALAVVLVACPCSMGLATPIGIWSALADLARRGVVASTSDLIEQLAKVNVVLFDKTGTLGEEDLEMVDFVTTRQEDRRQILGEVAALESVSLHPVARAFRSTQPVGLARDVQLISGVGVTGCVKSERQDVTISVGNASLIPFSDGAIAEQLRADFKSAGSEHEAQEVVVLRDGVLVGMARLRERLRASALPAVRELEIGGVKVAVLTGDRQESAAIHGLPDVRAGLSAEQKVEQVRAFQAQGACVLFVGDGVNDAPALAAANASLSIAGASGLAGESAMGELAGGDLQAVTYAITRSRTAIRTLRQNLWFAAAYNTVAISLAALGLLHPVAAALIMLVSSFTVSTRALQKEKALPPLAKTRPVRVTQRAAGLGSALLLCAGIAVQGPVIAYMGGFYGSTAAGFVALFFAASVVCFFWLRMRKFDQPTEMALGMFSLGGVAMLAGWWADAGLAPVVRDGVCLCGCAQSAMGLGLFAQVNWMSGGMVLASVPALFVRVGELSDQWHRVFHWLAGLLGMLVGMELAMWLMAQLPTTLPQVHFFATYSAMAFGMLTGMFAACSGWNRYYKSRK